MIDSGLTNFIQKLPKAELHVHIEGTLEPELMFKIAQRNNIKPGSKKFPFHSVGEVRNAYNFSNLQDFLDIYYQGANVLKTEWNFFDLAMAYFVRAHEDNVRHAEIFFDPQTHTDRGIPYDTVVNGLHLASSEAERRFGISSSWIHCFLRHLPEDKALESLKMAEQYMKDHPHHRIIGVGLDSSEKGHPPEKFARVFVRARNMGLRIVAHAGEEGPSEYVWQALKILGAHRIDHGNTSLEDEVLTQNLGGDGTTLTACPFSNEKLRVVLDLIDHPLPEMLRRGLNVTINSDDPAYFGGYIVDNYLALAKLGLIDRDDCITLARNSFIGSFLDEPSKQKHLAEIDAFAEAPLPRAKRVRNRQSVLFPAYG